MLVQRYPGIPGARQGPGLSHPPPNPQAVLLAVAPIKERNEVSPYSSQIHIEGVFLALVWGKGTSGARLPEKQQHQHMLLLNLGGGACQYQFLSSTESDMA